jgi:hypothetical protein
MSGTESKETGIGVTDAKVAASIIALVRGVLGTQSDARLSQDMSGKSGATGIEERQFELDAEIRRREIALKEAESGKTSIGVAQATIAGSIIALVSGVLGAVIAAWSSQNVEFGKSQASLNIEKIKQRETLS